MAVERPARPGPVTPRQRQVPRARPKPPSRATSRGAVVLTLIAASAAASGWWYLARQSPAGVSGPAEAAGEPRPSPLPAVTTAGAVSDAQVQQALSEAPLFAPDAARALLTEALRQGRPPQHALDLALYTASLGFADLDRAKLDELGSLFAVSWSKRSAADQARIQVYLGHARSGEPLAPEAIANGRELMTASVRSLPGSAQARLGLLFGEAIQAGIAHQARAEEGALAAASLPPPDDATPFIEPGGLPEPTPETAGVGADGSSGSYGAAVAETEGTYASEASGAEDRSRADDESYWRSRARAARAAVDNAEREVRRLESSVGVVAPAAPAGAACQTGTSASMAGRGAIELRELAKKSAKSCDAEVLRQQEGYKRRDQLDAARQRLVQAQRALADLEDEARRARALPGWLR